MMCHQQGQPGSAICRKTGLTYGDFSRDGRSWSCSQDVNHTTQPRKESADRDDPQGRFRSAAGRTGKHHQDHRLERLSPRIWFSGSWIGNRQLGGIIRTQACGQGSLDDHERFSVGGPAPRYLWLRGILLTRRSESAGRSMGRPGFACEVRPSLFFPSSFRRSTRDGKNERFSLRFCCKNLEVAGYSSLALAPGKADG